MNKIVKIAKEWQQDRDEAELRWTSLHKNQKTKNKMLTKQIYQVQAMNDSLERENERLWKMVDSFKTPPAPHPVIKVNKSKKRTYVEIVDLTEYSDSDEGEPEIVVKKEVVVKTEKEEIICQEEDEYEHSEVITELEEAKSEITDIQEEEEEVVVAMLPDSSVVPPSSCVGEEEEAVTDKEAVTDEEEEEAEEAEEEEEEAEEEEEEEAEEEEEEEEEEEAEEEEAEEEEAEEEEEEEEQEEAEKVEVKEEVMVEEEEEEVFMVNIAGTNYFTTNEKSGMIYAVSADGEVGDEVGYFENGEAGFYEE